MNETLLKPLGQEPGVYVRSEYPDQDLDFLWDRDRKRASNSERFQLSFFLGGLAVGVALTLLTVWGLDFGRTLLEQNMRSANPIVDEQQAAKTPAKVASPDESVETTKTPISLPALSAETQPVETTPPPAQAPSQTKFEFKLPFFGNGENSASKQAKKADPMLDARYYVVQSGDTLGSIALKFYKSTDEATLSTLQKANGLSSPDKLQLGQKLTIPSIKP